MHDADEKGSRRGPYKSQGVLREENRRQSDMMSDPDVVAFAEAMAKITDPKKRAHIAWLVQELARNRPPRR